MSRVALILGESGSGKSRSIKQLPPKETVIVNASMKDLPFKGASKLYPSADKNVHGHILNTDKISKAAKFIKWVSDHRPEIKYIVVDDNQYFSMFTYVRRAYEKDYYSKFTDIGVNMVEFAQLCKSLRDDITVFFLHHIETGTSAMGNEQIQAKTMGKFVKEKISYEGLFNLVLLCDKESDDDQVHHFFWTRLANSTVKSPEGMFEDQKIDNDLKIVADAMFEYYN